MKRGSSPTPFTGHRSRLIGGLVFENFQPKSEMKETAESHIVLIYLPGFTKERIRITYVHSSRIVRVSGERPIDDNRWIRFNQVHPVPENCEVDQIHAKFEKGSLTITIPKKVITPSGPQEEYPAPRLQSPSPPKLAADEPKTKKVKETIPPSKPTSTTEAKESNEKSTKVSSTPVPNAVADLKAQKGQEDTPKKPVSEIDGQKPVPPRPASIEPKPQKSQYEIQEKPTLKTDAMKGTEKGKGKESDHGEPSEPSKLDTATEKPAVKEHESRESSMAAAECFIPKVTESKKETTGKLVGHEDKVKHKKVLDDTEVMGPIKEVTTSASQAVSRLAKRLNDEDRQALINVGAAILVIVALGAYVSYRYSTSKSHN